MTDMPLPSPTAETRPFWEACAEGRLLFQRCGTCGEAVFYPRQICPKCQGTGLGWEESRREGTIHSFTIVHRAPMAAFKSIAPYALVLVDLDEGFRMMLNVIADPDRCRIGGRIRVGFRQVEGVALPVDELL